MAPWEEGEVEAVTTPLPNQLKYLRTTSTLTANQLSTPSARRLPTDSLTGLMGALLHRQVTLGPTPGGAIPSHLQTTDPPQPHNYLLLLSSQTHTLHRGLPRLLLPTAAWVVAQVLSPRSQLSLHLLQLMDM